MRKLLYVIISKAVGHWFVYSSTWWSVTFPQSFRKSIFYFITSKLSKKYLRSLSLRSPLLELYLRLSFPLRRSEFSLQFSGFPSSKCSVSDSPLSRACCKDLISGSLKCSSLPEELYYPQSSDSPPGFPSERVDQQGRLRSEDQSICWLNSQLA